MSINRVILSGNLTRTPELRSTANGSSVLGFGIAVNDRRKNPQTGEWEDFPNFIDCTVFGPRAEGLSHCLDKGSKISLEGKLRWSQWEREGQRRSKLEVIVDEIELMSTRGGQNFAANDHASADAGSYSQPYNAPSTPAAPPAVDPSSYNADLPF